MQERFSRDLADESNQKVCLHFNFLRTLTFFVFFSVLSKFLIIFKKNFHAYILAFSNRLFGFDCLQRLYLTTNYFGKKSWGNKQGWGK